MIRRLTGTRVGQILLQKEASALEQTADLQVSLSISPSLPPSLTLSPSLSPPKWIISQSVYVSLMHEAYLSLPKSNT